MKIGIRNTFYFLQCQPFLPMYYPSHPSTSCAFSFSFIIENTSSRFFSFFTFPFLIIFHDHFYNLPSPPLYWCFIPAASLHLIPDYFLYFCSLHGLSIVSSFVLASSCHGCINASAYTDLWAFAIFLSKSFSLPLITSHIATAWLLCISCLWPTYALPSSLFKSWSKRAVLFMGTNFAWHCEWAKGRVQCLKTSTLRWAETRDRSTSSFCLLFPSEQPPFANEKDGGGCSSGAGDSWRREEHPCVTRDVLETSWRELHLNPPRLWLCLHPPFVLQVWSSFHYSSTFSKHAILCAIFFILSVDSVFWILLMCKWLGVWGKGKRYKMNSLLS